MIVLIALIAYVGAICFVISLRADPEHFLPPTLVFAACTSVVVAYFA